MAHYKYVSYTFRISDWKNEAKDRNQTDLKENNGIAALMSEPKTYVPKNQIAKWP